MSNDNEEANKYLRGLADQQAQDLAQKRIAEQYTNYPPLGGFNPAPFGKQPSTAYDMMLAELNQKIGAMGERLEKIEHTPVATVPDIKDALQKVIPQFQEAFGQTVLTQLEQFVPRIEKLEKFLNDNKAYYDHMKDEDLNLAVRVKQLEEAQAREGTGALASMRFGEYEDLVRRIQELENGAIGAKGQVIHEFNEQNRAINQRIVSIQEKMHRQAEKLDLTAGDARSALSLNALIPRVNALEEKIEAKIARGEAHYWDKFDANGHVIREIDANPNLDKYPCPYCELMSGEFGLTSSLFYSAHNLEHCPHRIRMRALERCK